jgi:REP element-mobilizing transposase RayT
VRELERSFADVCERSDFRLVHYSLQRNHVHLLVEAAHQPALTRGMKAVGARLARAVNRIFQRSGPVLADRYHVRALKTPREVWNALRYVLLNARRHARKVVEEVMLDPASSARWFDGWRGVLVPTTFRGEMAIRPVAPARTWLLRIGWRRHGAIDPADVPGPAI